MSNIKQLDVKGEDAVAAKFTDEKNLNTLNIVAYNHPHEDIGQEYRASLDTRGGTQSNIVLLDTKQLIFLRDLINLALGHTY